METGNGLKIFDHEKKWTPGAGLPTTQDNVHYTVILCFSRQKCKVFFPEVQVPTWQAVARDEALEL